MTNDSGRSPSGRAGHEPNPQAVSAVPVTIPIAELRIVVVFRGDLPEMTRAKGEVQFGHAVAACLHASSREVFDAYMASGQTKISMEADSLEPLCVMRDRALKRGVTQCRIVDAGRTIFDHPTFTCVGFGPMSKTDSNAICRGARMRA